MSMSLQDALAHCSEQDQLIFKPLLLKMQRAGIRTVLDVLTADSTRLGSHIGCNIKDICLLQDSLSCSLSKNFQSAADTLQHQIQQYNVYSTGISKIDDMLDGGLQSGQIIEFAGLPASGKTQLCHFISAEMIASSPLLRVTYIDSGGTFYASRILEMISGDGFSKRFNQTLQDSADMLQRITHVRCFNAFEVIRYLQTLSTPSNHKVEQNDANLELLSTCSNIQALESNQPAQPPHLIIIDSVGQLFSPLIGQGGYATLGSFSDLIQKLAKTLYIPIITVNTSVSAGFIDNRVDGGESLAFSTNASQNHSSQNHLGFGMADGFRQVSTKPALGGMWDAVPYYRLYFTTSLNDGRADLYRVYDESSSFKPRSLSKISCVLSNETQPSGTHVIENVVELLDGPDKSKIGHQCLLFVSIDSVYSD
ncbi:hypothetical protein BATDEDRAFT_85216 [Batrachochytrium dendrobatidis JAM81]|uniref:RecA family profile 1 domain-containing protein n=1 Tax=Batrachochytrium dendrobatidis (strain JAM81 / FGSC 10211) TaxID=684364 RepID=F4NV66_BATDJ|nr:uncharacterized protein BATDEDRAFT_85216 [Batrachochytrium dendrobatidis JAM81]EGF84484.1 hypothetical protein BATDEDRAFT_85216 [Batrachochytrium dendrobatidis JAM81]|eukprot:XP_006676461.1 hypothetical protein BATDEDRAFT_85216 [Batrachochytrium dendrobatidis JAM81]